MAFDYESLFTGRALTDTELYILAEYARNIQKNAIEILEDLISGEKQSKTLYNIDTLTEVIRGDVKRIQRLLNIARGKKEE